MRCSNKKWDWKLKFQFLFSETWGAIVSHSQRVISKTNYFADIPWTPNHAPKVKSGHVNGLRLIWGIDWEAKPDSVLRLEGTWFLGAIVKFPISLITMFATCCKESLNSLQKSCIYRKYQHLAASSYGISSSLDTAPEISPYLIWMLSMCY